MADEQDWASYPDQAHVAATDTFLLRTAAGAGVEVAGAHVVARRADGGDYVADAAIKIPLNSAGWRIYWARSDGTQASGLKSDGYGTITITCGDTDMFLADGSGWRPFTDNSVPSGLSGKRWSVVYAATGTINTSDEIEKDWRGPATEAELRGARRIAGELGFYRWLDAIAAKGDAARLHFGARAQRVWSIMCEEGLVDPISADGRPGETPYAFLCFDLVEDKPRFGLRIDQLALFLLAAQEQRLAALEAATGASA